MSYSAGPCNAYKGRQIAKIDQLIANIRQEFARMDFENAAQRNSMEDEVDSMLRQLEQLRSDIASIGFE